ncbi:uncharacterized protein SCHCODRAFT_02497864 [Schizophyllum commune H4-8]|uniref:uncharacterized protein n=1 Tax=Schizophyllum commune (strain H4-8 / FGSC 9210) TaxID=578458 RepID=UPI00215DFC7D|nr:uncharacterized protein SCHCODRAFT_02497864 [Schizophyllum commune H4-8]KAI5893171.1 hypothetical protein SCHCODRAFT_02497864 [Schizophyllum commune H4-8]
MNPPSASLRTPLPTQPTTHAANGASSAPSLRAVAPAASIETTIDERAPNIAGLHPPGSSSTLPAQAPAAVDLPAWPLPLATDPFHHGAYIAMLSLAEKLGAPVNHQLLALALVPTLALYPGSVLRSDNDPGVPLAQDSAAPSTTVPPSTMPSRRHTTYYTADRPAPPAAMATVPSPAVSVPSAASYVPSSAVSVPPPASSAAQATTNPTPVSGQRVQRTLNGSVITTSTAVPMSTSTSQENNTPTTPTGNDSTDAASANMDDTSAPPQERKRNTGGKRVWLRIEKAKVRDALRAADARRAEQSKADVTGG